MPQLHPIFSISFHYLKLDIYGMPVLDLIYRFNHVANAVLQTGAEILEIIDLLQTFLTNISDGSSTEVQSIFSCPDKVLQSIWELKLFLCSDDIIKSSVRWFPEFGCALISIDFDGDSTAFHLICLKHEAEVDHFSFGCIDNSSLSNFWEAFDIHHEKTLKHASNRGVPKTPGFIVTVVKEAVAFISLGLPMNDFTPCGSFPEVSTHTAWPLVHHSVAYLLSHVLSALRPDEVAGLFALFDLHNARSILQLCEATGAVTSAETDCVMVILRAAVQRSDHFFDKAVFRAVIWEEFATLCTDVALHLEMAVKTCSERQAEVCTCTYDGSDFLPDNAYRTPQFTSDSAMRVDSPESSLCRDMKSMIDESKKNLGGDELLFIVKDELCSLITLLSFVDKRMRSTSSQVHHISLNAVDSWLYGISSHLKSESAAALLEIVGEKTVDRLLETYRRVLEKVTPTKSSVYNHGPMRTELRSREILAGWICYCVAHCIASSVHELVRTTSVSLNWTDLSSLVLSDKAASDAVLTVCCYLQKHEALDKPLFSLRPKDCSMEFATEFGHADRTLQSLLAKETDAAVDRVQAHWERVVLKKKEAIQLMAQIGEIEVDLAAAIDDRGNVAAFSGRGKKQHTGAYIERNREVNRLKEKLKTEQNRLAEVKKPPPTEFMPLPRDNEIALRVLFFLFMPKELASLAKLSFVAQQLLLPRSFDYSSKNDHTVFEKSICGLQYPSCWEDHFNSNSSLIHDCLTAPILLKSRVLLQPVQPGDVLLFATDQNGICFPDALIPCLAWNGGGFALDTPKDESLINPFIAPSTALLGRELTELVSDEKLRVFMPQLGFDETALTRSNDGIALQGSHKPDAMNTPQFLTFASLRAYPQQQIRKVCHTLRDKLLSLNNVDTHALLKQALFQVGSIAGTKGVGNPPTFLWKLDLEIGEYASTLVSEIDVLASELTATPKNHRSLKVLIEIAAYLSQWSPEARMCARRLSRIAYDWAVAVKTDSTDVSLALHNSALKCVFMLYSLLGHAYGELNGDDSTQILTLNVLICNIRVFENPTEFDAEIRQLTSLQEHIMARRAVELRAVLTDTKCAGLFLAIREVFPSVPRGLQWSWLFNNAICLQSKDGGHLLSVNVMSGVFLYDGRPLTRLNKSVRCHALFKRSFGDSNFEVKVDSSGAMVTVREIAGRVYSFVQKADGSLHISESDNECAEELVLLDSVSENTADRFGVFPSRLRDLHSHWQSTGGEWILFRPMSYAEKSVDFMYSCSDNLCYAVPAHLRQQPWLELTHQVPYFNQLVLLTSDQSVVDKLFVQFEDREFIHVLVPPQPHLNSDDGAVNMDTDQSDTTERVQLIIQLPRYGLTFEMLSSAESATFRIVSSDFKGYEMSSCQRLTDTLLHFGEYLILQCGDERKVLVPKCASQMEILLRNVKMEKAPHVVKTTVTHIHSFYVFDVHARSKILRADSVAGRLYLAALYAASSTLLPESRSGMTGDEVALQLVRESWVNRPLNDEELGNLKEVVKCSGRSPALALLCLDVYQSSRSLGSLYSDERITVTPNNLMVAAAALDIPLSSASVDYQTKLTKRNIRSRLSEIEEDRILSGVACHLMDDLERSQGDCSLRSFPYVSFSDDELHSLVQDTETQLLDDFTTLQSSGLEGEGFPFDTSSLCNVRLGMAIVDQEKISWKAATELVEHVLNPDISLNDMHERFKAKLFEIGNKRADLEEYLLHSIASVPSDECNQSLSFRMSKVVNLSPGHFTSNDLLKIAVDPTHLRAISPFYSNEACALILEDIVLWLTLCVLEDKLGRLVVNSNTRSSSAVPTLFIVDLKCIRNWSPSDHIEWLVFEVENRLQIRPPQFTVAMAIVQNPGAIVQLNMGEGKTSVIIPMLTMYWAKHSPQQITRLHFLTYLLNNSIYDLHRLLCASTLNKKIFLLPFSRDVDATLSTVTAMLKSLRHCKQVNGCLLVAPEHRLSFHLKLCELRIANRPESAKICAVMETILNELEYIDMLDECDEILRPKYQLVYSVGNQCALPSLDRRCCASQAVFKAVATDACVQRLLSKAASINRDDTSNLSQAFNSISIASHTNPSIFDSVCVAITAAILATPPYDFRWLNSTEVRDHHAVIQKFVSKSNYQLMWLQAEMGTVLTPRREQDLLALRGLLACGMMFTMLEKRHRKDYGINRNPGGKLMAVPFRASDTPSERSEFSHPEVAIGLTILSYYYDGLSRAQVLQAVNTLMGLNESTHNAIYSHWLSLLDGYTSSFDTVGKLDVSNSEQMDLLVDKFSRNRETVNFWLNSCVLPTGTRQFTHKITANAWNLTDNKLGWCMGFAGTDDTSHLLPMQVQRHVISDVSLVATNGIMMSRLLSDDTQFIPLNIPTLERLVAVGKRSVNGEDRPMTVSRPALTCRRALLDLAASPPYRALIDVGALCTGSSNVEVADQLLVTIDRDAFVGVVYFDTVASKWMVKQFNGVSQSLRESPIAERDCFVYFDESRCRGSDMKLRPNATALATLGPKMCKDKLVQAAGRMRQFGVGQQIHIVAASDVHQQIVVVNELTSDSVLTTTHVMMWALHNTIEANKTGMLERLTQGLYFTLTGDDVNLMQVEEKSKLEDFYTLELVEKSVQLLYRVCEREAKQRLKQKFRYGYVMSPGQNSMLVKLSTAADKFGVDVRTTTSTSEEEAEKQLEKEVEKEVEAEIQLPCMAPAEESDWDFKSIVQTESKLAPEDMARLATPLSQVIMHHTRDELQLSALPWTDVRIFVTNNFASTIEGSDSKEYHLRMADACLCFSQSQTVLLLSEREADAVLSLILDGEKGGVNYGPQLLYLSDIRRSVSVATRSGRNTTLSAPVVSPLTACLLMLFNGETSFESNSYVKEALECVLKDDFARQCAALKCPLFRGKSHLIPMSDLEMACTDLV